MDRFTRRGFVGLAFCWAMGTLGVLAFAWAGQESQADPRKWADAPGPESADVAARIGRVADRLRLGASPSEILCDRTHMDLHPYPRFRALIKSHATANPVSLCSKEEPGEKAILTIEVVSSAGAPLANALVYVYHTSSSGWYAANGYHVRANSGNQRHARLFGYGRTNKAGKLVVQTIRPGGYPDGNLPAHYHVEVLEPTVAVTEVLFSDDPRLAPGIRSRSRGPGFVVCDPKKDADGRWRISAKVTTLAN